MNTNKMIICYTDDSIPFIQVADIDTICSHIKTHIACCADIISSIHILPDKCGAESTADAEHDAVKPRPPP